MQNVLAKLEMFEEIGGGETSKQGQEFESVSCQANNVGQFRQALRKNVLVKQSIRIAITMVMHYFHTVLEHGLPPNLNSNHNAY